MKYAHNQKRALQRWEFEYRPDENDYCMRMDNLIICWSVENQVGAYTMDGEMTLLLDWEMLDDIMQMLPIY